MTKIKGKRPVVERYHAFKDACRLYGVELPQQAAHIVFILPMPKSWSEKKKTEMRGRPHTTKPDLSNLLKALEDALFMDDAKIWHYGSVSKRWGREGCIRIREGVVVE